MSGPIVSSLSVRFWQMWNTFDFIDFAIKKNPVKQSVYLSLSDIFIFVAAKPVTQTLSRSSFEMITINLLLITISITISSALKVEVDFVSVRTFLHLKAAVIRKGSSTCRLPSNYGHRNVCCLINTHIFSHAWITDHPVTSELVHPRDCCHLSPSHLHPASREVTSIFSTVTIGSELPLRFCC